MINKYAANWDIDRLAKVDLVIINLAISELKEFKDIPVKVTLNEFRKGNIISIETVQTELIQNILIQSMM